MKTGQTALALGLALAAGVCLAEQARVVEDRDDATPVATTVATPAARGYSPYAGRKYPTQVYWGDTHHHTSNSG